MRKKGNIDPITPIVESTRGIGRTLVPVAESTSQPGEEAFTPCETPGGGRLDQISIPPEPSQAQNEPVQGAQSTQEREEPEWALPESSEPHRSPGGDAARGEIPSQMDEVQEGEPARHESLSPEQRIVEADKRCQKRLAALARDHIVKLREESQRLAYDWLEEYSM